MKEAAEKADGKWAELPKHGDKDFVYYYVKGAKALYAYHIEDKDYYVLSTAGKSDLKWQRQSGFDVHQGRAKALEAYLESKK